MDSTVNKEEMSVKSCGENKSSTSQQQSKRGRPKKDKSTSTSPKDELDHNDVKKSKHQLPDHDESKEAQADTSTSRDERSEKNIVDHQDHGDNVVPNHFDHVSKRRRRRKGMPRRAAV